MTKAKKTTREVFGVMSAAFKANDDTGVLDCAIEIFAQFIENQERQTVALERIADILDQQTTELRNIEANGRKK